MKVADTVVLVVFLILAHVRHGSVPSDQQFVPLPNWPQVAAPGPSNVYRANLLRPNVSIYGRDTRLIVYSDLLQILPLKPGYQDAHRVYICCSREHRKKLWTVGERLMVKVMILVKRAWLWELVVMFQKISDAVGGKTEGSGRRQEQNEMNE
ncbi:hypothetical protein K503DRAFT_230985 [Rhizopogon vinicolor AM-OR11-026]|uniref:Uncharacterized protein n=1 Tax=Rhizopogon vinicolor AM-OR11-026 TaxID=1314800 RepID=A0A1B7MY24_9AGAM|nr:hypothetical protein K503DRAFT_230985 [Rhizopogon vinicolor AM-OR11-026]